jgi:hypothetical protein
VKVTQLNDETIVIKISKRRTTKRLPSNENEFLLEQEQNKMEMMKIFGQEEIPSEWREIFEKAGLSEEEMKSPSTLKYVMKKAKKFLSPTELNTLNKKGDERKEQNQVMVPVMLTKVTEETGVSQEVPRWKQELIRKKSIKESNVTVVKPNPLPSSSGLEGNIPPWKQELEERKKK